MKQPIDLPDGVINQMEELAAKTAILNNAIHLLSDPKEDCTCISIGLPFDCVCGVCKAQKTYNKRISILLEIHDLSISIIRDLTDLEREEDDNKTITY